MRFVAMTRVFSVAFVALTACSGNSAGEAGAPDDGTSEDALRQHTALDPAWVTAVKDDRWTALNKPGTEPTPTVQIGRNDLPRVLQHRYDKIDAHHDDAIVYSVSKLVLPAFPSKVAYVFDYAQANADMVAVEEVYDEAGTFVAAADGSTSESELDTGFSWRDGTTPPRL
jgi:hypothetical protein